MYICGGIFVLAVITVSIFIYWIFISTGKEKYIKIARDLLLESNLKFMSIDGDMLNLVSSDKKLRLIYTISGNISDEQPVHKAVTVNILPMSHSVTFSVFADQRTIVVGRKNSSYLFSLKDEDVLYRKYFDEVIQYVEMHVN